MDWRSRYGGGWARRAIGRAHVREGGRSRNSTSVSKIASNSINHNESPLQGRPVASESQRCSSKKVTGTIKSLIHEETSMETKVGQSSQSVIAKLMGLDSSPPPKIFKQPGIRHSLPKPTYRYPKIHSSGKRSNEHRAFQDVTEIRDPVRAEKQTNQPGVKRDSHLDKDNTDMSFVRQKFMVEANRLSTDETLQGSKEFNDAIEVLDSSKDLFLDFLDKPNSLFTSDRHNLKTCPPAQREDHITILRASKSKTGETDDVSCRSEVKYGSCTQMQKDAISTSRKPVTNLFNHLHKEDSVSLSYKLLKSRNGKTNTKVRSSRVAVLKPNLGKTQNMGRSVSHPSHEKYPCGYRRHREFQQSGIQESFAEGREQWNLFDNMEVMSQRKVGSRGIAREIRKQMKCPLNSCSDKMLFSSFNRHTKDDSSCALAGMHDSNKFGRFQRNLDNFDYWSRASSPSSSCSSESSFGREARKRLSERWRMTKANEAKCVGGGSSTSGEMSAISDRKFPKENLESVKVQKVSDEQFHSFGVSSGDGLMEECFTNLPRSPSISASSPVHGMPKSSRQHVADGDSSYTLKDVLNVGEVESSLGTLSPRRRSSRKSFKFQTYKPHLSPSGEENKLPVIEIHVNQEEQRNEIYVSDSSKVHILSKFSEEFVASSSHLIDSSLVTESLTVGMLSTTSEGNVEQPAQKWESSAIGYMDGVIEDTLPRHLQLDSAPSECSESGSDSMTSSRDAEQQSPVSVLEHSSNEGLSNPHYFGRASAGLQELRMQLHLLRLKSDKYNRECKTPALSEDCIGEILLAYKNEEDRDYSYLVDIINLGIYGADQDILLSTSCSTKHSVDFNVFEKLEGKYGLLVEWSRLDRRLLDDLISSSLTEILSSGRKLELVGDRLIEEVWQMLVRKRKELSRPKPEEKFLDPRWLDVGDDIETIGREIESMLEDDLLEEVVFDLLILSTSRE
ncbi:uncharacterized protein A4U43_C02F1980 [Asparagus officinalis]|uniref:DUF4378 domain-containing protein n=1 Tax=Asparagus officinalis TaxID=4686 RepID=A0A5P1FK88_ASPOF|nr:uncharacterized protein A4U43_C02F1980 [Asparagus officinalis]